MRCIYLCLFVTAIQFCAPALPPKIYRSFMVYFNYDGKRLERAFKMRIPNYRSTAAIHGGLLARKQWQRNQCIFLTPAWRFFNSTNIIIFLMEILFGNKLEQIDSNPNGRVKFKYSYLFCSPKKSMELSCEDHWKSKNEIVATLIALWVYCLLFYIPYYTECSCHVYTLHRTLI